MFSELAPKKSYSRIGLQLLVISIFAMVLLSIADGLIRGYAVDHMATSNNITTWTVWVSDFRFFFEQGIYAATVFFVGAKFVETRTVFSVSFDKLNSARISVKGPDENNVVWIGHAYATSVEARVVADALTERLRQSAA